jgi:hypothetical protein
MKILLSTIKYKEAEPKWPDICNDPSVFLNWVKSQLFVEICDALKKRGHNIKVLLTGFSRRYVINNLTERGIPVAQSLRVDDDMLNALYDTLDWYFVTSKYEGGPQAVLECGYRKARILSTPVGMAPWVLEKACLADTVEDFVQKFESDCDYREQNYGRVADNFLPKMVIARYDDFFERLM